MLKAEFIGSNTIKMNDIIVKDTHDAPVSKFCRELVNKGYEDQPLEIYRGDMKCMIVKSIKKQAKMFLRQEPYLAYEKVAIKD